MNDDDRAPACSERLAETDLPRLSAMPFEREMTLPKMIEAVHGAPAPLERPEKFIDPLDPT